MGKMSKRKGASYERLICQRLSLWVSELVREDVFWRSAMSGGRASLKKHNVRGRKFDAQSGDLSAIHEVGYPFINTFVVDCKHKNDLKWSTAIYRGSGNLAQGWEQVVGDAKAAQKLPMMITRQNRDEDVVVLDSRGAQAMDSVREFKKHIPCVCILPHLDLHTFFLRDLITDISATRFIAIARLQQGMDAPLKKITRKRLPPELENEDMPDNKDIVKAVLQGNELDGFRCELTYDGGGVYPMELEGKSQEEAVSEIHSRFDIDEADIIDKTD